MEVIVLHVDGGHEPDFSVWENEEGAAKQACTLIAETIDNELDLNDPDVLADAKKINDLIKSSKYLEAVNYWNDCDLVSGFGGYFNYYWIESRTVGKTSDVDKPELFNVEPEDEDTDSCSPPAGQYQPIMGAGCGATCRKCHTPNEYATPDKADGTYVCRGCNMLAGVFGG